MKRSLTNPPPLPSSGIFLIRAWTPQCFAELQPLPDLWVAADWWLMPVLFNEQTVSSNPSPASPHSSTVPLITEPVLWALQLKWLWLFAADRFLCPIGPFRCQNVKFHSLLRYLAALWFIWHSIQKLFFIRSNFPRLIKGSCCFHSSGNILEQQLLIWWVAPRLLP